MEPHLTIIIHHKSSECFFHCYALTTNSIPICDSAFEHNIHEVSPCIYTITKQLM